MLALFFERIYISLLSIIMQEAERDQYPAMLTELDWSIIRIYLFFHQEGGDTRAGGEEEKENRKEKEHQAEPKSEVEEPEAETEKEEEHGEKEEEGQGEAKEEKECDDKHQDVLYQANAIQDQRILDNEEVTVYSSKPVVEKIAERTGSCESFCC